LILPLLVLLAICGSFFAGHYIGRYDAEKHHSAAMKFVQAAESAGKLRVFASVASLLRESKYDQAIRVLELSAELQVAATLECLSSANCAWLVAPTAESRETLQRLAAAYAAASAPPTSRLAP
jgi:hypothetical protein